MNSIDKKVQKQKISKEAGTRYLKYPIEYGPIIRSHARLSYREEYLARRRIFKKLGKFGR